MMLLCFVAFLFGLIFGSFLNVCIYRIPEGKSVLWPPSSCPKCGSRIRWYDNIPVLSYIVLKGKCRNCGKRISPIYPAVELLTGVLTSTVVCSLGLSLTSLFYLILLYSLIVGFFVVEIKSNFLYNR